MDLTLRPASLSDDGQELAELLERNIPGLAKEHAYWRHESNPAGPGWSWVISDSKSGTIAAMVSVLPRHAHVNGRLVTCGVVGDFVVDAAIRSLGPAVTLQRATFGPVNSGALAFCYDAVPHDRGMSTFMRLGMSPSCEVIRHACPLRSDEYLGKRLGRGAWTKPVFAVTNLALRMRVGRPAIGLEILELGDRFGDEFSDLDRQVSSSGVIRSSRSAADLTWRYRSTPGSSFRVLVARRVGELWGFLAFRVLENRASIMDLFGMHLSDVGSDLLGALIDVGRREGLACLEGYLSEDACLNSVFARAGFRPRERAARIVAYTKPASSILNSGARWSFGGCDITQ
jgi:hypothetical protein